MNEEKITEEYEKLAKELRGTAKPPKSVDIAETPAVKSALNPNEDKEQERLVKILQAELFK